MNHTCPKCLVAKPATEEFFYKAENGLCLSSCKMCRSKAAKIRYQARKREKKTVLNFYEVAIADRVKRAKAPTTSIFEDVL